MEADASNKLMDISAVVAKDDIKSTKYILKLTWG